MAKITTPTNTTINAIYDVYEKNREDEERSYLGCSTFGTECDRALWYSFHWASEPEQFSGRTLRLFETGNREEVRMIVDLETAGITMIEDDFQKGVLALSGHLRGHLDGAVLGIKEAPKTKHVLECKTHNDKSYRDLLIKGVKKSKPGHYAQMQLYMGLGGYERAYYLAVNKNDDSLYGERVRFDKAAYDVLMRRAERIIRAETAPGRISDNPEVPPCVWCHHKTICHVNISPQRRNCRTCLSSTAVISPSDDDAPWRCEHWDKPLTLAEQKAGCEVHLLRPSMVNMKQVDADEERRTISYQGPDCILIDGGERQKYEVIESFDPKDMEKFRP